MVSILSNKKIIIILQLFIIIFLFLNYRISYSQEENIHDISLETICNGIFLQDSSLKFIKYPLFNLKQLPVKIEEIKKYEYSLIVTCSPYLCGGLERANISLINKLSQEYPNQIYFVTENFYIRDTRKALNKVDISDNIKVLLDEKGRNISRLKKFHKDLNESFYLIVDKNGVIKYLVGKSYYYHPDQTQYAKIIKILKSYLDK